MVMNKWKEHFLFGLVFLVFFLVIAIADYIQMIHEAIWTVGRLVDD